MYISIHFLVFDQKVDTFFDPMFVNVLDHIRHFFIVLSGLKTGLLTLLAAAACWQIWQFCNKDLPFIS